MGSVERTAATPSKSRLARTFAKVLHIRAVTGVAPVDGIHKIKSHEKVKHDRLNNGSQSVHDDNEKLQHTKAVEAFLSKLFASISTVKAAYAQLQFSQSPYDADGIQAADEMVVSELKNLSELKQSYVKKQLDESSPAKTQLLAELQEQKKRSWRKPIERNKLIEKRLNSSGLLSVPDNLQLSSLSPSHFITVLRQTTKSIRSFVRFMINEMELAGWDLDAAAMAIEPVRYWNPNHKCFAFESFVCREMFDGFNYPNFSNPNESLTDQQKRKQKTKQKQKQIFFDRFTELKSMKTREYLALKPKSTFGKFCFTKYLELVHPKMESSLFGNLNHRDLVSSGEHPETTFYATFAEMAKRVWLLRCLAFSFEPEASIFRVGNKCRFSEVYMESMNDEAFLSPETDPLVAFTVVPGFKIGKTAIQCQVYLS
ncbi:hypothetical protein Acr_17g0006550 [Actinidia rufa]|uniref:DUF641 domain-containing protein n=1 Tax=Actinidia rufa TaxID=165716 RepID=A0A7J0G2S8_9ERIC|nr:hypothetical protein Acr_17g0006550 [Actinidia rufa]